MKTSKGTAHTTQSIHSDLISLVGKKIAAMKSLPDLDTEEIMNLDRLCRIWESLRKEEREQNREAALDEVAATDLDHYAPLVLDYLKKRTGT